MRIFTLCLALCLALMPRVAMAQEPLVVGIPCLNPDDCGKFVVSAVLAEAFSRAGLEAKMVTLPPLRDLESADALEIDASGFRMPEAIRDYTNLVVVKAPVLKATIVAVFEPTASAISAWDDLKGEKVGFVRGSKYVEIMLREAGSRVYPVNSLGIGLRMLDQGRLDVLVAEEVALKLAVKTEHLSAVQLSEPLYTGHYHLSLHRSHADLVPRLEKALEDMSRDGSIRSILGAFGNMAPEPATREPLLGGDAGAGQE